MKSNSLLTYVLYGLLGLFILAAGYYACQRQKEKKEQAAREAAELEETLRDMGYASEDSLAATGSSYTNKDSLSKSGTTTKSTTNPNISKTETKGEATSSANNAQNRSPIIKIPTRVKSSTLSTKKSASAVKGPGTGRWAVRAGTFTYMEGARRRLEEVIRAGYPNAEISKTKDGLAAVIVFRSNDKDAAIRIVDQLEMKGIDAAVFDRTN